MFELPTHSVMASLSRLHFDLPHTSFSNGPLPSSAEDAQALRCSAERSEKSLTRAMIVCYISASTHNLNISSFAVTL